MKKVLLFSFVLIFIVGCTKVEKASIKERTMGYLLSEYTNGIKMGDANKVHSIMPNFVYTNTSQYSEDIIKNNYDDYIQNYGNNFNINYKITEKGILNEIALNKLNELIRISFKTNELASECYYVNGNITYSGTKNYLEDTFNAYYCKYDNTWYLIMN